MRATWRPVEDPDSYVHRVLSTEAPEIPGNVIPTTGWVQARVMLDEIDIDLELIERHDRAELHQGRRDSFIAAVRSGVPLPPLILLGGQRRLVDGYARYRALRALGVAEAEVLHVL